ncbi:FAD-binding oxidoreductase [Streptomyces sp. NBC_01016]|uniref:NAD(P)/FAD-dependent oxidoreductase n=1 Tax=Streptomyces sp. NBC_01016 TaxID=2903720 RepID=UPI00225B9301|nr:FAD-binding oxidoreductase [Streptomyces sp. NBC_01016]MCX4831994.1 FAD-binding oxidoreductase [Streptomyces sp. NBC_01016]
MDRVVVVGAGVLGASVAYHLARSGADVVVLEAERSASGASGATLSLDVTHLQTPYAYYRLNRAGSEGHLRLAEEIGGPSWRHPAPLIQWADGEAAQQALRERALQVRSWGHACDLAPAAALREAAPEVDPAACSAEEVVVHTGAAWFDAPRFVQALLEAAARHGAELHSRTPVTGLLREDSRVTGVVAGERRFTASTVVNCAGSMAEALAALAGVRLPMRAVPGLLVESGRLPDVPLGAILAAPGINLRPTPDGGVLALSRDIDARLDARLGGPLDGLSQELFRRAGDVVPELRRTGSAASRVGFCPVPLDELPLVGAVPGAPGLYHLVAHSGVTLAPVLGRLAADEITTGRPSPELAAYRPDRAMSGDVYAENMRALGCHVPQGSAKPDVQL